MALDLFDRNQYTDPANEYNQPANAAEVPAQQPEPAPAVDTVDFDDEYREPTGARWPLLAGLLVAALIVAVGIVFGGRWAYDKLSHKEPSATPRPAANDKLPASPEPDTKPNNSSSAPNPYPNTPNPGTGTSNPTPSTGQTPSTPSTPSDSNQLPNNGPGSILALFVGSSLVAAGLHYVVTMRKQYGVR